MLTDNEKISSDMTIWTAGVKANDIDIAPEVERKNGKIVVDSKLNVINHPNVYALGDVTFCCDAEGKEMPMLAQSAAQQSKTCAHNIMADIIGEQKSSFRPHLKGMIISVGQNYAVGNILGLKFGGFIPAMIKKILYRTYILILRKTKFAI